MSSDSDYSEGGSGSESDNGSESDSGSGSDNGNSCPGGQCGMRSKSKTFKSQAQQGFGCRNGQCGIGGRSKQGSRGQPRSRRQDSSEESESESEESGSESEDDCGCGGPESGSESETEGGFADFTCCSRDGTCGGGGSCGRSGSRTNNRSGGGNMWGLMGNLGSSLPFDPASIENIILSLSDKFNFRVVMNSDTVKKAAMITTGLSIAGTLIGRHYGGKMGAAVGGAVGGICGVGLCVVAMRDVWEEVKFRLAQVFDLVYDYLVGLGVKDYRSALKLLTNANADTDLAKIVLDVASSTLGKQIMSSLTG